MRGSPLYPAGQVHTGRSDPDLSNPAWHWAPGPRTENIVIVDIVNTCRLDSYHRGWGYRDPSSRTAGS